MFCAKCPLVNIFWKYKEAKLTIVIFSPGTNELECTNVTHEMRHEQLPDALQQPHCFLPSSLSALFCRSQKLPLQLDSCITRRLIKMSLEWITKDFVLFAWIFLSKGTAKWRSDFQRITCSSELIIRMPQRSSYIVND